MIITGLFFTHQVNTVFSCYKVWVVPVVPNIDLICFQMALSDEEVAFHSNIPAPLDIMVAVVYSIFGEERTQKLVYSHIL